MPGIVDSFRSFSGKTKSATVFSTTLLTAVVMFYSMTTYIGCRSRNSMEPYRRSDSLINAYMDSLPKPHNLSKEHFAVFKAQQKMLSLRKGHYRELGLIFFKNYYGVLVLLMVFSCLGGVVLFLIANQGWAQTGPVLRALFLAVGLIVGFFGLFPRVFDQKENFDANLKQYMSYTKAEVGIVDQLSRLGNPTFASRACNDSAINTCVGRFDSLFYFRTVDSMIAVNNAAINGLTNHILNMDASKIGGPPDFYNSLNGYLNLQKGHVVPQ